MQQDQPLFDRVTVGTVANPGGRGEMNTLIIVGDVNGNGRPDIVISGRFGSMVWLENPGALTGEPWKQHLIDQVQSMECGGVLYDLTGNGLPDVINGSDWRHDAIWWWENVGAGNEPWTRRLIARTGHGMFHDTAIGRVKGDGRPYLVFTNQSDGTGIYATPLPEDPTTVSSWPHLELVAGAMREDGQPEEGLAIADIDGDGLCEIVCGVHWYKHVDGRWQAHRFASGYITTKIAVGDVDGDGRPEIVLSEGDPCIYGRTQGGRLAWFKPGADITAPWEEHLLAEGLLDAHSLQLADMRGTGALDMVVGEIGVAGEGDAYVGRLPRLMLYENDGHGTFRCRVLDEGTGIHDAFVRDMLGRGLLDIVGKPLHGPDKWNVHVWYHTGR
ncbi:MAG: FG-GAP repeat domain-containing protein [Anaerolineae bacterium]